MTRGSLKKGNESNKRTMKTLHLWILFITMTLVDEMNNGPLFEAFVFNLSLNNSFMAAISTRSPTICYLMASILSIIS